VLNVVRVGTGEVRFFITELSMTTLTPDQRRIVRRFAKDVIEPLAPVWSDVGHNCKEDWFISLLDNC
jgi:hypothetical protein